MSPMSRSIWTYRVVDGRYHGYNDVVYIVTKPNGEDLSYAWSNFDVCRKFCEEKNKAII